MKHTNLHAEKSLLHEIEKASDSIRRKHKLIKYGRVENERITSEVLGPITEPLKKMLADVSKQKPGPSSSKNQAEKKNDAQIQDEDYTTEEEEYETEGEEEKSILTNNDEKIDTDPLTFPKNNISDADDDDTDEDITEKKKKIWMMKKHLERQKSINSHDKAQNTMYTIQKLKNNKLSFGNSMIEIKNHHIYVRDKIYPATQGLLELLFQQSPNASIIRKVDREIFIEIIKLTNAHRKNFKPDGAFLTNRTQKYKNYVSLFVKSLRKQKVESKKGSALVLPKYKTLQKNKKKNTNYIYWDDPNELVNRLQLLVASEKAGNNSHSNEILSIIEELREAGIIC